MSLYYTHVACGILVAHFDTWHMRVWLKSDSDILFY